MSPPETNDLSPAPDRTITWIAASARKSSITSAAASDMSSENALRFSGLLKTSCPTGPFLRAMILSVLMSCILLSDDAVLAHGLNLRISIADTAQDFLGVLPCFRRRAAD